MAMAISNAPVLTGEVAEAFVRKADEAMKRRGSIDFTEQLRKNKMIDYMIDASIFFEQRIGEDYEHWIGGKIERYFIDHLKKTGERFGELEYYS